MPSKNHFIAPKNNLHMALVVLRDPTNSYTGSRWNKQEFIETLKLGYWPPDMIVLDKTDDTVYVVRGNEFIWANAPEWEYQPQQILPLPYGVDGLPCRHARRVAAYA
jgi:hypothetical protein